MENHAPLPSAVLVIFGITGDLAKRKLLPALYYLAKQHILPDNFRIIGVTRQDLQPEKIIGQLRNTLGHEDAVIDAEVLTWISERLEIISMDLLSASAYIQLRTRLDELEKQTGQCMQRLYYLAIPPQTYGPIIEQLAASGLNKQCSHNVQARLLVEKPFGYDLASATELIRQLNDVFPEESLYRIDHYLAKETAQNILTFRFENAMFRQLWDRKHISHIFVTAAEQLDIEGRAAFYEQTGALRDVLQNHVLQLLALATMEEPSSMMPNDIHRQKLALFQAIQPIAPDKVTTQAVRGQYQQYRTEVDNARSSIETYAALRLEIDNERWRGVPILLRTGKALAGKTIEITVIFHDPSHGLADNELTISIQPNEGVGLSLRAKKPGFAHTMQPVSMDFRYKQAFTDHDGHPDAYERVLADAIRGDRTLFASSDEVLASWRIITHVLDEWSKDDSGLELYAKGSTGPQSGNKLAKSAGTTWPALSS